MKKFAILALIALLAFGAVGWGPFGKTSSIAPVSRHLGNWGAAQTDTVVWSPIGTNTIVITDIIVSCESANTITIEENGTTQLIAPLYFGDTGGMAPNLNTPIKLSAGGRYVTITSSVAANHSITLIGREE